MSVLTSSRSRRGGGVGKREKTATFIVLQDSVFNVDAFFGHKHQFGSSRAAAAKIQKAKESIFCGIFFLLLFLVWAIPKINLKRAGFACSIM